MCFECVCVFAKEKEKEEKEKTEDPPVGARRENEREGGKQKSTNIGQKNGKERGRKRRNSRVFKNHGILNTKKAM